ncbi:MAG: MFS transporter [Candidatus Thermoplasmatota archaeon]|jgi:predicted MFS family arabinose efflux permease|nr:MFS transporter [Candidatus Thermoplasmatota archaeon]MCL5954686.1 MFS transporter [Candidatus Thermoplasmatota archaeon]
MNRTAYLVPYWILNFTIGFGWFSLAPLVPSLISQFSVGLSSITLLISIYGYTMVIFALASGYLSARFSVSISLVSAAVISSLGLFLRALSPNYDFLLASQIIAAIAYPLALGPVGSLAQSISRERSHMIVGISVGILFLGMSAGAFLTHSILVSLGSVRNVFLLDAGLSLLALVTLPFVTRKYPADYAGRSLKGVFKAGMFKNWYVGLIISSFSVMFGGIAAVALGAFPSLKANAESYSGVLTGLSFLGSALGAIILPPLFEAMRRVRTGMIVTSLVAMLSMALLGYGLAYSGNYGILMAAFFMFGFFGNAYWSMAMTSTTRYSPDPAQAGFATSMYSVATNLGVAFIPTLLGPYFLGNHGPGVGIVIGAVAFGFILSFFLKVSSDSKGREQEAPASQA